MIEIILGECDEISILSDGDLKIASLEKAIEDELKEPDITGIVILDLVMEHLSDCGIDIEWRCGQ